MTSREIQCRQNKDLLLKIQFAAREFYNSAERFNHYSWAACLISALSVFCADNWPIGIKFGIPFVADILAFLFMRLVSTRVKTAALMRSFFDAYVLDINPEKYTEAELRKIKELAETTFSKQSQRATIQIANTGNESPPGVREWYTFSTSYDGLKCKFECQRQNIWWNSKLVHKRIIVIVCIAIVLSVFLVLLLKRNDVLLVLLCSASIIIKLVERLLENIKYETVSHSIEGSQQTVEANPTEEGVERLQEYINERRTINVLEFNQLHKKNAKLLLEVYDKTTKQ